MRNIPQRQFLYLLSIVVGLATGLIVVVLKYSVHFIQSLLHIGILDNIHRLMYGVFPLIGILLTVFLVKRLVKQSVGHGVPTTLYSISKRNSNIRRHNLYSSMLTSAITVGLGGSVGLEGPAVVSGAAWGSNIGRMMRLGHKAKTLLIGCAAAGAMAAIFKAPIAAIVFAIEVIMLDLTMASLIPLLLASVSAVLTSRFILGEGVLFHFKIDDVFTPGDIPFYVLLGVITGLFSLYFTKATFVISNLFERIKGNYHRALIGGAILGVLIFLLPPLYGEGYATINSLISGNDGDLMGNSWFSSFSGNFYGVAAFLLLIALFKAIATNITFGSGGVGGIFAPALFIGSTVGFIFSKVFNHFGIALTQSNFTLVGMAGTIAGILQAPLTAIFLIAEITNGYDLFIPLMIVASISYITTKYFMPHSVYHFQLAKRGELITHHKDKAVLTLMNLHKEIETNFIAVRPEQTLGDLVKIVAKSERNIFPVVEEDGSLLGVVTLSDIKTMMFNPDEYRLPIIDLMTVPPEEVDAEEGMDRVMEKFDRTGAWNLPVLDDGKYIGFVSKSKLFNAYRKKMIEYSED